MCVCVCVCVSVSVHFYSDVDYFSDVGTDCVIDVTVDYFCDTEGIISVI